MNSGLLPHASSRGEGFPLKFSNNIESAYVPGRLVIYSKPGRGCGSQCKANQDLFQGAVCISF